MQKEQKNPSILSVQQKKQTTQVSVKEKPTVQQQPQAPLKSIETLPKEQVKASTIATSKITSSLKSNPQKNPTTFSQPKPSQNEIASSKISQRIPLNSTQSNQVMRNQSIKQDQSKGIEVDELKSISFKIKSSSDIPLFAKAIEPLIKKFNVKINLTIVSNFSNDKDFQNFCDILMKIASKIRNLIWKISGRFTNEETSKQIGEVIGKCVTAFSINLNTGNAYFTDKAAESLALGLKKLSNIRILLIQINWWSRGNPKRMTEEGCCKINKSIELMKKLQKVDYNGLDWGYVTKTPQLGNYIYQFHPIYEDEGQKEVKYFQKFEKAISPFRGQLTELTVRKMEEIDDRYEDPKFDYKVQRQFLEPLIIYSIQNLPYLTHYQGSLLWTGEVEEIEDKKSKQDIRILQLLDLILNLTRSRLEMISIITIFNRNIIPVLPLNPQLIIADLFID